MDRRVSGALTISFLVLVALPLLSVSCGSSSSKSTNKSTQSSNRDSSSTLVSPEATANSEDEGGGSKAAKEKSRAEKTRAEAPFESGSQIIPADPEDSKGSGTPSPDKETTPGTGPGSKPSDRYPGGTGPGRWDSRGPEKWWMSSDWDDMNRGLSDCEKIDFCDRWKDGRVDPLEWRRPPRADLMREWCDKAKRIPPKDLEYCNDFGRSAP